MMRTLFHRVVRFCRSMRLRLHFFSRGKRAVMSQCGGAFAFLSHSPAAIGRSARPKGWPAQSEHGAR
eukprot:3680907-Pleurochrysis_carterae.AAC.1